MYHQFKSDPKRIVVQSDPIYSIMYGHEWCFKDQPGKLHTCFAWLGHGSFVSKQMVLQFLQTVSTLGLPADQVALADNFFTTSFNQKPLVIVVPEIFNLPALASGFSDGHSGLQRNRIYIQKGVEELFKIVQKNSLTLEPLMNPEASMIKSTNLLDTYSFITNSEQFPNLSVFWTSEKFSTLNQWENQLGKIGKSLSKEGDAGNGEGVWSRGEDWMVRFPFSAAIDGDLTTCWRSINPISKNEFIGIKFIDHLQIKNKKLTFHLTINKSLEVLKSIVVEGFLKSKWIPLSITDFICVPLKKIKVEALLGKGVEEDRIERCFTTVLVQEDVREEGKEEEEDEGDGLEGDGLEGIRLVSLVDQRFAWSVWEIELRFEEQDL